MNATILTTPDGPFSIIVDTAATYTPNQEVVLASGWTNDLDALLALVHPSLRPTVGTSEIPTESTPGGTLAAAADAVHAYYNGELEKPGQVPVLQASGPYRTHAWDVLHEVKAGERLTYSEYAQRTGRPSAVRAAAGACAKNAVALFVPCHRILRSDGTLGGFRYGLSIKESLLKREM